MSFNIDDRVEANKSECTVCEELRIYKDSNSDAKEETVICSAEFCHDDRADDRKEENKSNATTKFFNGNSKTTILPKIRTSSSNQITAKNESLNNQLDANRIETKKSRNDKLKYISMYVFDCFLAAIVVGPMVVAHWRGIWVLMDFHPDIFSGWMCFSLGLALHFLFAILREPLHQAFALGTSSKGLYSRIACRLIRTIYLYLFSLACNFHWRGVWILLIDLLGIQAGTIFCFTFAILGDLIVLRCLRNLLAPPYLLTLDNPRFVFQFPTRYRAVDLEQLHTIVISNSKAEKNIWSKVAS